MSPVKSGGATRARGGAMPAVAPPAAEPAPEARWKPRPTAARAIQLIVLAVPIAASVGVAALVSAELPHARHVGAALGWWAVVLACSTVTLIAVDRLARRLLPLALLLRLSLLFPDQAPKRFRLAARSWSTRRVRDQITRERTTGETTAPMDAATQVIGLLASLAAHDRRTRGHCERVRAYNDLLAEELGLPESDRDRLRWAALIHDIGKLEVSRRVLNKPGKPTPREWEELRAHPERGAEIAAPLAEWLGPWALAIAEHHEHWDGTGYPHGLAGTDISLGARIVGVADAFEVMTSPRPYSKPMSAAAARAELASCAGTHFDPQVVRALLNISLGRLRKAMGAIAWFSQVPLLASMPRLSAALIQGGQQAAAGAGGAIGVVAVSTVPAAATHHVHEAALHHPAPAVQSSTGAVDPLAAVLALTGRRSAAPQVAAPAPVHGQSATHSKASGHAATAQHRGQSAAHSRGQATHTAGAQGSGSAHGQQTATTKRHHGQTTRKTTTRSVTKKATTTATAPATNSSAATAGRCGSNSGSGVGNGGGTAGTNTQSHNTQPGVVLPAGLSRCD